MFLVDILSLALPRDRVQFIQKLVINWYGLTVSGQLWIWPLLLYLLLHPLGVALLIGYLLYAWGPGLRAAETESWGTPIRKWRIWKYMADYFSATVIATTPLDPRGNYIFCVHPHGCGVISTWINFATDATDFPRVFPGIVRYPVTLASNFKCPVLREYVLACGLRSASKTSIVKLLASGPGRSIVLCPGGAAESLYCRPGHEDLVLKKRKGFVRMALKTGASLVPSYAFGETNTFDIATPHIGTLGWKVERFLLKMTGIAFPLFHGEGVFTQGGLLPHPVPLVTVVGAPIEVPKVTREEGLSDMQFDALVEKYHQQYLEALQELYVKYSPEYGQKGVKLRFVE